MASNREVYSRITARIIESIEAGVVPWRQPWKGGGVPRNLGSQRPYNGINRLILAVYARGMGWGQEWLTYQQAKGMGGHVQAGERGTPVVFFRTLDREETQPDGSTETRRVPLARVFVVFNAAQCADLPATSTEGPLVAPVAPSDLCAGYLSAGGPQLTHGGSSAFYRPSTDAVSMPAAESFETAGHYHSVLFHELTHSTGHSSRLNRPEVANVHAFGDTDYSREELVAELGAAFLCGQAGIETPATLETSAGYLAHWLGVLREDPGQLVKAASAAQKAADLISGVKPDNGGTES